MRMKPRDAVNKLRKLKWTEAQIGEAVGTTQATINRIRHNKKDTCTWQIGAALVALASRPDIPSPSKTKAN
jgi:hypothetical protein